VGFRDSAACKCGPPKKTPEHILASQRRETWPQGARLQAKLWGTSDDLESIVLFMTHSGDRSLKKKKPTTTPYVSHSSVLNNIRITAQISIYDN
jgi:hypothetical protein